MRIRGRKERGKENQDMCIFLGDRKLFPGGSNEHHSGNGGRNCWSPTVPPHASYASHPSSPTLPFSRLQRSLPLLSNALLPSPPTLPASPLQRFPPISNASLLTPPTFLSLPLQLPSPLCLHIPSQTLRLDRRPQPTRFGIVGITPYSAGMVVMNSFVIPRSNRLNSR